MAEAKHTPGPYSVERAVVCGYRGGRKFIGWRVMKDGVLYELLQYRDSAVERAEVLNRAAFVESLAEKMANAGCGPDETLWMYLGETDRNTWRAAARVAVAECAAISKSTGSAS